MAEKTEWPSEQKISDLRKEGRIYISATSIRMSALASLCFLLMVWFKWFYEKVFQLYGMIPSSDAKVALMLAGEAIVLMMVGSLIIAAICFVVGLLQTGIFIQLNSISPRADRLWFGIGALSRPTGKFSSLFITPIIAILFTLLFIRIFLPELLKLLITGIHNIAPSFSLLGQLFLWFVACVSIVVMILSWLVVRYRFMLQHRMTRAEVESEARQK